MVIVALCFSGRQLYLIQVLNDQNTLIVQSILQNMVKKKGDTIPSSLSSTPNSLLWLGPDTIINASDPMQNLGQTQIFYKPGQTHLTQTTRDPDNQDDPTRFQPW